ncbi:MAG: zf-HC2 domain-containing protein, partial [Gemmatimonadota bacterium]|nr:zf-HC2 domain-containing protein [Gemmatimonadota bacterium]
MTHLDDGRLRALLDEELSDADYGAVRIHLAECETCRTRMTKLEERGALVTQALGRLITAAPTEGARTAVLERLRSLPNGKRVGPALP